jgi:hypothetical protein
VINAWLSAGLGVRSNGGSAVMQALSDMAQTSAADAGRPRRHALKNDMDKDMDKNLTRI